MMLLMNELTMAHTPRALKGKTYTGVATIVLSGKQPSGNKRFSEYLTHVYSRLNNLIEHKVTRESFFGHARPMHIKIDFKGRLYDKVMRKKIMHVRICPIKWDGQIDKSRALYAPIKIVEEDLYYNIDTYAFRKGYDKFSFKYPDKSKRVFTIRLRKVDDINNKFFEVGVGTFKSETGRESVINYRPFASAVGMPTGTVKFIEAYEKTKYRKGSAIKKLFNKKYF